MQPQTGAKGPSHTGRRCLCCGFWSFLCGDVSVRVEVTLGRSPKEKAGQLCPRPPAGLPHLSPPRAGLELLTLTCAYIPPWALI